MKNFTVKLVELGNPFLDIVDVRWGRFHDYVFNDYQALLNGDFFINPVDVEATALFRSKSKDGDMGWWRKIL